MKKKAAVVVLTSVLCVALALSGRVHAAESGMGHYVPGAMASFIDGAPTGFVVGNIFNYYNGSVGAGRALPIGINLAASLDVTTYADVLVLAYGSSFGVLGGKFNVAEMLPYIWADVKGELSGPNRTLTRSDHAEGLGDITLFPFWLGWTKDDFKWDVRLAVYAPTGAYDEKDLANVGLNYWTFEPIVSFSYISKKTGLEVSAFAGLDFNTENDAVDYQSGDVLHLDVTLAEHLPLFGYGVIGIGANAFYWDQITGDSGSGATLGSFEGRTVGIGPVLSYISPPICGQTIMAEVKWLPELDVENRLSGDYVWFKLV
jgi:hypothetical protein